MSYRILVVKAEQNFIASLASLVSPYQEQLQVTYVPGRKEAMSELNGSVFDRVVTALKIPRASDGYLFLSHLAKILGKDRVIVVADDNNAEVMRSVQVLGVKQLYAADNVREILQNLVAAAGLSTPRSQPEMNPDRLLSFSEEQVRSALNWVMGPVGPMIFAEAVEKLDDRNDLKNLVAMIEEEIGEAGKIAIFRERLVK